MPHSHSHSPTARDLGSPTVDDVSFKSLYTKEEYDVLTNDGWSLVITRYKPLPQAFAQPLLGVPVLCVHGFSQNRHTWTCGELVKNLLFFGLDVHLLELRGHGKSSVAHQRERLENDGLPLPADIDCGWTFDSYALLDVPAAIDAVKVVTGRRKIAYVGHSMGGMIGYYLAGVRQDLTCLFTIGAAAELGKDSLLLRSAAHLLPPVTRVLDTACASVNVARSLAYLARKHLLGRKGAPKPSRLRYSMVPIDWVFAGIDQLMSGNGFHFYEAFSRAGVLLFNPRRLAREGVSWLLTEGAHAEPRGVVEQLAGWIRDQRMTIAKTGYDLKKNYARIHIPLAIVFGDRDFLASMRSTSRIYRAAKSEYLLWRPVRGNSHLELTMGYDVRQMCYDIKNIIEYAEHSSNKPRSLPRRDVQDKPN